MPTTWIPAKLALVDMLTTGQVATTVVFAALLGGAFGSFAGVVVSRGWHGSIGGRSHCDSCARTLSWYELVPFVSFISLRGRCRTCHALLGWGPLLWELAGAAVALAIAVPLLLLLSA
jgi:prepilin signal peptidase PulO-like enzyme (type II secretory pathway)